MKFSKIIKLSFRNTMNFSSILQSTNRFNGNRLHIPIDGKLLDLKMRTPEGPVLADFDVPARLDVVFGCRTRWFDLDVGQSINGTFAGHEYTLTRSG